MPKQDIENITDYFPEEKGDMTPEEKWDSIFQGWINTIDQKNLTLNLFELKLWLESMESFFTSNYLEKLVFKYSTTNLRNYDFYLSTFVQVVARIINHLKELDFKKDKYLLNFEEFIVESILEDHMIKSFPYLRDVYLPESWFYSLRIFLQNLKTLAQELTREDLVSQRIFSSVKKLYHKELINNPIIVSLLKRKFVPKMDKIYQKDISEIISAIRDKDLKKHVGIFFVFSFRIVKIYNFIESNLNKSRNVNLILPLLLVLKKNLENVFLFYDNFLEEGLKKNIKSKAELKKVAAVMDSLQEEYKKIYEGELPKYFNATDERINRRKIIKNIVIISDVAIQEVIETVAKLFKPEISGSNIFEIYISRKQQSLEVKSKLSKLHDKISEYFSKKSTVSPADLLFDTNLFIETDLNYLLFKDWNEFLNYYNNLVKTNFSTEFDHTLRSFHSFISDLLKELGENKK